MTAAYELQDEWQNAEQRRIIAEYARTHGAAWLGIVNRYPYSGPWLWEWNGKHVETFAAAFVVPKYDHGLVGLLDERDREPWTPSGDALRVRAIFQRVADLGGEALAWR